MAAGPRPMHASSAHPRRSAARQPPLSAHPLLPTSALGADALLANKAHEPLPPVLIEQPRLLTGGLPRLAPGHPLVRGRQVQRDSAARSRADLSLPAGSLRSLLSRESITLHSYRWRAEVVGGEGEGAADAAAAADPQLQQLLGSLQGLGLLLPEPLPERLPAFSLAVPAPPAAEAASPDNAGATTTPAEAGSDSASARTPEGGAGARGVAAAGSGGAASISVRLEPACAVVLDPEQLQQLLGCSTALISQMFSRGGYCGAAGKLVAAAPTPGKPAVKGSQPAPGEADAAAAAAACGATVAPCTPTAAAGDAKAPATPTAAATAAAPSIEAGPAEHMQVDGAPPETPAEVANPAAVGLEEAPLASTDAAEAAAAAAQLVSRAVHSVLLLHDKKGLPRRRRKRGEQQASELQEAAAAADDSGYLFAPLLPEARGSSGAASVDWAAVRAIASAAAFEGTLLKWLAHGGQEELAAKVQAREGGGDRGSSSRLAALAGHVLVTSYNAQIYLHRCGGSPTCTDAEGLGAAQRGLWCLLLLLLQLPPCVPILPAGAWLRASASSPCLCAPSPSTPPAASSVPPNKRASRRARPAPARAQPARQPAGRRQSPWRLMRPARRPAAKQQSSWQAVRQAGRRQRWLQQRARGRRRRRPPSPTHSTMQSDGGSTTLRPASRCCARRPCRATSWRAGWTCAAPASAPLRCRAWRARVRCGCWLGPHVTCLLTPCLPPHALPCPTLPAEEVHLVPQLCVLHPVPAVLWPVLGTVSALMWQLEGALAADQLLNQLMPADLPPDQCARRPTV